MRWAWGWEGIPVSKPRQLELHCIPLPRNRKEKQKVTTCANMQTPLTLSLFMGAPSADTFNSSTLKQPEHKSWSWCFSAHRFIHPWGKAYSYAQNSYTHALHPQITRYHTSINLMADDSISALNSARLNAYRTAFTIHRDSIKCPVCIRWSRI